MWFLQNMTHMPIHWTSPVITSSYSTQNPLDCALLMRSVSTFMLRITASNILQKSFDFEKLLNPNLFPLNTEKHFPVTRFPTKLLGASLYFFPNTKLSQQHLLFYTDCLYSFHLVAAPSLVMMVFFLEYFQNTVIGLNKTRQGSRIFCDM